MILDGYILAHFLHKKYDVILFKMELYAMKITKIEVYIVTPENFNFNSHPVIAKIVTDEGYCGIGEAGIAYGIGHSGAAGALKDLGRTLLGCDPLQTEKIWNAMMTNTFWGYCPGPLFYSAVSALDVALWDIKGKFFHSPVWQMLGGACHTTIRAYASQVQFGWDPGPCRNLYRPAELREVTRVMMDSGFDCVKINPFRYDQDGHFLPGLPEKLKGSMARAIVDRVRAVREEGGDDLDIIVECNSRCSAAVAIQVGGMLEELHCMYLEEPVTMMEPTNFRDVAQRVNIPLAAGERLFTRWQFMPYLQERLIGLAQPDVGLAGGITETKKICDLARTFDVGVQAHVCGGPVAVAAALQIAACCPNYTLQEHHVHCLKPSIRNIVKNDYQPEGGHFDLPDRPGIGVELDEDYMKRFLVYVLE